MAYRRTRVKRGVPFFLAAVAGLFYVLSREASRVLGSNSPWPTVLFVASLILLAVAVKVLLSFLWEWFTGPVKRTVLRPFLEEEKRGRYWHNRR
ncbi:MAG: hypothetical protein QXP51_06000 [Candidatus Hadarchaeales archaeon]